MPINKLPTLALESNAITADLIASGAITAADISDGEITAAKLHTTLDFSTKTFTMHNNHVTQAMVTQHQAALSLTQSQISDLSTTNLTEGTNLYYTDSRADARAQIKVDALVDAAPGTLDTLNELAAALGDDPNFATTVTNSIATKLPLAGGTMTGDVNFGDTNKAIFGAGSDLQIFHWTNNASYIQETNPTNSLFIEGADVYIRSYSEGDNMIIAERDGAVTLHYDNAAKLATTSTGISITGNATFADNGKAIFGAGSDLQIYHNPTGSHSYITESGGGSLYIQGTELNLTNAAGTSTYANFVDGGAAFIRHAGATKLATTTTGIDVTGGVSIDDDNNFSFGDGTTYIQGSGAADRIKFITAGSEAMRITSDGNVGIGTSSPTANGLTINSSVSGASGMNFHIGGSATAPSAGYYATLSNNNHGDVLLATNAYINTSSNPVIINTHATMGATGIQLGGNSNNTIRFYTQQASSTAGTEITNAERMRIDTSGNVGIGTDNPDYTLVVGNTSTYHTLKVQGSGANLAATVKFKHHGGGSRTGIDPEWNISRGSNETSFNTGVTSGNALVGGLAFWNNTIGGSNVDAMRLKDNGDAIFGYNVGIGTATPTHRLQVNGTAADGTELLHISSNGDVADGGYHWMTSAIAGSQTTNANIIHVIGKELASKNSGYFGFHYAGDHSDNNFITLGGYAADQLLNIKMNGNVGIGTTSPLVKLDAQGSPSAPASSGTAQTGSLRLSQTQGNGVLDMGFYTSSNGTAWLQSTNKTNLATNYDIALQPNGGNVGIGITSPTEKLHVAGVIRSEGYDTDAITSYNITGSYTAGTEYVFTTRSQINGLGYGGGFYKFLVWSDTFHAGTSHYQCYTPYDEFYFNNYGSNASGAQTINYGVSMGHAPNTFTRAIDIKLRHKYGVDATYPANQTFTFVPVNGFTNLNGNAGYHLRIYLFKVA